MTLILLFLLLLVANLSVLFFTRSAHRYWLVSIPLWTLLLLSFFIWRVQHDQLERNLEASYWQSAAGRAYGDYDKHYKLKQEQASGQRTNMHFINLIGIQTLLTFGLQVAGSKTTQRSLYKWTGRAFTFLFVLYLFIRLLMGVVPSTGYVT